MKLRITTTELAAATLLLAMTVPGLDAMAAPFCLETQAVPPQCIYVDPANCQREATRVNGLCVANPAEVAVREGTGAFCLTIGSGHAFCEYQDLGSCLREAAHQGGACTLAVPAPPGNTPDPYRFLRDLQAG